MSNNTKSKFATMVAEFGSNWKTITDAAKTREEAYQREMGPYLNKKNNKKNKKKK